MLPSTHQRSEDDQEIVVDVPSRTAHHLPLSNVQLIIICTSIIVGLLVLIPAGILLLHALDVFARLAPVLAVAFVLFLLCFMAIGIYGAYGSVRMFLKRQEIQTHTFVPDPGTPNYPAYLNEDGTFSQPQPGIALQPVPHTHTYAPHLVYHGTKELPVSPSMPEKLHREISIPSFAESLALGHIGPGQQDILYGWEITEGTSADEEELKPIRGGVDLRQTMFLVGGMQCGKSTLVANWMAQEAAGGKTVFLVIDPHKNIPDTSLTARIAPLLHAGYLAVPPAGRDPKDIARVLKILTEEIDARFAGKETRLSDLKITFVVDEALALARMTRMSKHDPVYDELFAVMQSVATETAKAGITGLYLAQLSSKDQMGDIDIRDACPGCVILKTPYQQALNLKLTGEEARTAHFFKKGHGFFIGAAGGEPRRFAFGETTVHDIANLVDRLPGSPLRTGYTQIVASAQTQLRERGSHEDSTGLGMWREIASQADVHDKMEHVLETLDQGIVTKDGIIEHVWKAKKGKGRDYQQACLEYEQVMRLLSVMARREMESQAGDERKEKHI